MALGKQHTHTLNDPAALLKAHELRKTDIRIQVLKALDNRSFALTHGDIETALSQNADRVTIYRTLHQFEQKGIVHKVMGDDGVARYALCQENCNERHHHDNHIHFHCTQCNNIYCLDEFAKSSLDVPEHYVVHDIEVTVKGICPDCKA